MNKLLSFLSNIPKDKLLHYVYAQWIFVIIACISKLFLNSLYSLIVSLLLTTTIMIYKEKYDKHNNGSVEVYDVLIGLIAIMLIILMIIIM